MPTEFWLELGCEEIPAKTIAVALQDLRRRVEELLREEKLGFDKVEALGSARRFVVHVPALAEHQESRTERTLGPPAKIAYNNGQPSPALQGFAKKNNISLDSLKTFSTDRGEYIGFDTTIEGANATDILAKAIPQIVQSMSFPKTMIWVDPTQRFSRPLRWIIAKHGDKRIPIELFGVQSASFSEGHRILGSSRIDVASFEDFIEQLEMNFVIVSQEERRRKIQRELETHASELRGRIVGDERLLEEVVYINEYPTVVRGTFDQRFLDLPREILVTVMKEHQKYFAVENEDGELMPYFLAVMNTDADVKGYIRKGHETVLRARLTDALFFWNVDRKQSLEERRARLKSIVFQDKLGSYADKIRRMLKLAKKVNSATKTRVDSDVLTKAVQWSKSDLTTDLVREFTELQGVMGGLYAKYEGAAEDVWRAIYDQYKPQSLDDRSPATRAGAVLSITDKLDTVLSCFSVGIIPTGSEDPLGLRRAMQGVIKTLLDHHLPFSLEKVAGAPTPELKQFYEDRLRFILSQRGFAYDEINAVVNVGSDDAADALDRIEAIRKIRSSPDFEAISLAFKRIKNILRQAGRTGEGDAGVGDRGDGGVGSSSRNSEQEPTPPSLEPAEADLFALLNDAKPKIDKLARSGKYLKILETMAASRPVIDHFFDKIMVMHEDQEVRKRRIALLRNLFAAFSRVADISEIVVQG